MKYIFYALIGIICTCCSPKVDDTVPVPSKASSSSFDGIVESISLLPLSTESEHLLGSQVELILVGDGYVLIDSQNCKIYKYNSKGLFEFQIGRKGNGPGEYPNINNVQYANSLYYVYSLPGYINIYDKSGSFVRSEDFKMLGDQTWNVGDDFLTYYGYLQYPRYRVALVKDGLLISGFLESDNRVIHFAPSSPVFSENDGNVFFIDAYSNVLYMYADGKVAPYISFDFGKFNIKKEFFEFADVYEGMNYLLSSPFALINRYYENEKIRFVETVFQDDDKVKYIYGISRASQWQWFSLGSPEDCVFAANVRAVSLDALYFVIDPSEFDKIPKAYVNKMMNPECLNDIIPGDNYVIAKVTLK